MAVADVFDEDGLEVRCAAGGGEGGEGGSDLLPEHGGLAEKDIAECEGVVRSGRDGGAGSAERDEGG